MKSLCVSHFPTSLPPVPMLDCLCIPSVNFSPLIFPTSVHLIHDLPEVRGHGQQIREERVLFYLLLVVLQQFSLIHHALQVGSVKGYRVKLVFL